ncbi:MAG: alpha/beta fold hydrolase [Planctomycetales bacterium]
MSDAAPIVPAAAPMAASGPPRSGRWRRLVVPSCPRTGRGWLRWIGLRILLWPVLIVAVFGLMQRWLIYHPHREARILPAQARLADGQVHAVSLATHDGLELNGWHVLPDQCAARDAAECDRRLAEGGWLVLYLHGNAGNRRLRAADCRDFTRLGAHVFLFDYRGYGDNPGAPSEAALVADARTLWDYAVAERGVAPERIVLYGESLGGGVATRLAADLCADGICPAAVVLKGTFSSLADVGAHHFPVLPVRLLLVDRYESAEHIRQVTCPVLSIHGALDEIVPIEFGRRLFEAAPARSASGIEKRMVELAARGHNDLSVIEFAAPISALFDRIAAANGGAIPGDVARTSPALGAAPAPPAAAP